jgi:hypothetical protein
MGRPEGLAGWQVWAHVYHIRRMAVMPAVVDHLNI